MLRPPGLPRSLAPALAAASHDALDLDLLLEVWARAKLKDGAFIRSLGYPTATPEHRYARRGGLPPSAPAPTLTVEGDLDGAFELVDRAMAGLRGHCPRRYAALAARYLSEGPDERRAQALRMDLGHYRDAVAAGKRWLKRRLEL